MSNVEGWLGKHTNFLHLHQDVFVRGQLAVLLQKYLLLVGDFLRRQ